MTTCGGSQPSCMFTAGKDEAVVSWNGVSLLLFWIWLMVAGFFNAAPVAIVPLVRRCIVSFYCGGGIMDKLSMVGNVA